MKKKYPCLPSAWTSPINTMRTQSTLHFLPTLHVDDDEDAIINPVPTHDKLHSSKFTT